jgi:hypothetical protein
MSEMREGLYTITDRKSLDFLLTKRRKRYRKFVVAIESLEDPKAKYFEDNLNKYHASCGCTTGNHFLSTAIVLSAIVIFIMKVPVLNWKMIIPIILLYLVVGITGKITGKVMDAYKFRKTVESLFRELN